jgi:four helix bundle protein
MADGRYISEILFTIFLLMRGYFGGVKPIKPKYQIMDRIELEKRLVRFCGQVHLLTNQFDTSFASHHLAKQIFRSASGSVLNYAESQGAESKNDFIHKNSIVLKELRETNANLMIIKQINICEKSSDIDHLLDECNQLISIIYTTIRTSKKNQLRS